MTFITSFLPYIQLGLSFLLVIFILIQHSEAGMGGSSMGQPFRTKRGLEKAILIITVIVAILFALSAILAIL